jgi:hypothetical protein
MGSVSFLYNNNSSHLKNALCRKWKKPQLCDAAPFEKSRQIFRSCNTIVKLTNTYFLETINKLKNIKGKGQEGAA